MPRPPVIVMDPPTRPSSTVIDGTPIEPDTLPVPTLITTLPVSVWPIRLMVIGAGYSVRFMVRLLKEYVPRFLLPSIRW